MMGLGIQKKENLLTIYWRFRKSISNFEVLSDSNISEYKTIAHI